MKLYGNHELSVSTILIHWLC